jgi:putative endonuclease
MRLPLRSTSRSRAVVARRAHNPKVGSSNLPFATARPRERSLSFMYVVYILYSTKYNKIYVGYTSNLQERLISHNELGKKGWTIKYRPWTLVYSEQYESKELAIKRERELKFAKGRAWIWSEIIGRLK